MNELEQLDVSNVRAGSVIKYRGDSMAFGGEYDVVTAESTYGDPNTMPESEKGKLMIIEYADEDNVMFFPLENLNPKEWTLVG